FGRGYFAWLIITNAAREGARTAVVANSLTTTATSVQNAMSGLYIRSVETGTCQSALDGVLCVTADNILGGSGTPVTIHVRYNFKFLVIPKIMSWAGASTLPSGAFAFNAASTMRLE